MYTIEIRLKENSWDVATFQVEERDILTVHIIAFEDIRRRSSWKVVSFLPLGNMEYVIWGRNTCLGFLSISELAQNRPARGLEEGT